MSSGWSREVKGDWGKRDKGEGGRQHKNLSADTWQFSVQPRTLTIIPQMCERLACKTLLILETSLYMYEAQLVASGEVRMQFCIHFIINL